MTQLATGEQPPIPQDTRLIPLTQGKYAIVDAADYKFLMRYKWHARKIGKTFYAANGDATCYMHRLIVDPPAGMVIDHIDGDGLNNTRRNLRAVTHRENIQNRRGPQANNTSGHLGVSWHVQAKKWVVRIKVGKVYKSLGYFSSLEEAAKVRKEATKRYYGEFS